MLNRTQVEHWPGRSMFGRDGASLGTIKDVFADPAGHPAWATVRFGGRLSRRVRFVPIADAAQRSAGIIVPFTGAQVADAPDADRHGNLTAGERHALHAHYGLREDATLASPGGAGAPPTSTTRTDRPPTTDAPSGDGSPPTGRADDEADPPARPDERPAPGADRPTERPATTGDAGPPATPPLPSGPADLDALPTFDPDGPAVGDPEDPRFDPPGGRKAPRRRGPGTPDGEGAPPDGDLLEPPADDHGSLAAAGPAEDPLLSDDPGPGPPTPPDGPTTGDPTDRVAGDPSDPRGGDPGDDPVFPTDLPDFPDLRDPGPDGPDERG